MKTDRELLELAAKAAGLSYIKPTEDYDGSLGLAIGESPMRTQEWNPLTDDGDALRLAVELNIVIWECNQYKLAGTEVRYGKARGEVWEDIKDGDPYAATRRAIVRAAAAIGEQMP